MTIIEQIKAEIERLKGICTAQIKANPGQTFPFVMEMTGYDKLLSFLSTLESEKPTNQDEELEKEIDRFEDWMETYNQADYPTSFTTRDIARHFAEWGAERQKEQDEKEQADLFTIVALDAAQRAKDQMMKDIPKWHKVQRGSCFDKHTNFLLSAREGHFYCSSIEVPRDGYILLVDELERLPKEDEK